MNLDDKIFEFIFIEAIKDATMQLSYKGNKRCLMQSDLIDSLKGDIEHLIDKVFKNGYSSQEEYDEDFLLTTISICRIVSSKTKNDNFTFGNAQKLINIMMKYFYITTYNDNVSKETFKYCHCPMDQKLLKNIWDKCKNLNRNKLLGKSDYFLKSWGNENFEFDATGKEIYPKRYNLFQQAVRCFAEKDGINPIEYDYCVW